MWAGSLVCNTCKKKELIFLNGFAADGEGACSRGLVACSYCDNGLSVPAGFRGGSWHARLWLGERRTSCQKKLYKYFGLILFDGDAVRNITCGDVLDDSIGGGRGVGA